MLMRSLVRPESTKLLKAATDTVDDMLDCGQKSTFVFFEPYSISNARSPICCVPKEECLSDARASLYLKFADEDGGNQITLMIRVSGVISFLYFTKFESTIRSVLEHSVAMGIGTAT